MSNAISVIILAVIFGIAMAFVNWHTIKHFNKEKDSFFLIFLIAADIGYLSIYLPAGIMALTSLL